MIVAKPKVGTLFSLGIFISICLIASGYAINHVLSDQPMLWYHYAILLTLFPIGLGLFFRLLLGYRIVKVAKERIEIAYPLRFTERTYKLKDISSWKETKVKTVSGTFKELDVLFANKKHLKLSIQEHTDYPQLVKYLNKKCAKLRVDA